MTQQIRRKFTPQEKVAILRQHLLEGKPVSNVCDSHGLKPSLFTRWQKEFFENGARLQSAGQPWANASNMAKVLCSEYAGRAADLGIQILGGLGYSAETDMPRYWRDARLLRIGPISNEMARNMIAEGLGLPRSF